jgi:hypothetical protein
MTTVLANVAWWHDFGGQRQIITNEQMLSAEEVR